MSTTYRVLSDTLYRSVAMVTTANVITEAYDTDAYGNTLCYSGSGTDGEWFTDDDVRTNNPINTTIFTGRLYDPESQIYWYRTRYYSPQIGRFISRDKLEDAELRGGPNLYWYVGNNPVNAMDPSGAIQYSPATCVKIGQEGNICIYECTCREGFTLGFDSYRRKRCCKDPVPQPECFMLEEGDYAVITVLGLGLIALTVVTGGGDLVVGGTGAALAF